MTLGLVGIAPAWGCGSSSSADAPRRHAATASPAPALAPKPTIPPAPIPAPTVCATPKLIPPSPAAFRRQRHLRLGLRPTLEYRLRNDGACRFEAAEQDGALMGWLEVRAEDDWVPYGDRCGWGMQPTIVEPGSERRVGNSGQAPFAALAPGAYRYVVGLSPMGSGERIVVEHRFEVTKDGVRFEGATSLEAEPRVDP